jgi:hypothetical protein
MVITFLFVLFVCRHFCKIFKVGDPVSLYKLNLHYLLPLLRSVELCLPAGTPNFPFFMNTQSLIW